jgi:hypothetical protein
MLIGAIDLGTISAWVVGDPLAIGTIPTWGYWKLAGTRDLNASFVGLFNEVSDLLDEYHLSYVVYETPLAHLSRGTSRNVPDLMMGLAATTRLACSLRENPIPVYEQSFAEVRKLVIGKGSFPKPFMGLGKISKRTGKLVGDAKEEVRIWVERYGWGGIDQEDGRDAAVLFRYAQMLGDNRA